MTHPWDEFSKSLAEQVPRRESLRRLGAVFAGAVLAPVGLGTAWAKGPADPCKAFCDRCPKQQRSQCQAACRACNSSPSRLCGTCGNYACCSTSGLACCGGTCVDIFEDFDNCGGCGDACHEPGPYEDGGCVDGTCLYKCVSGALFCNGTCRPVLSDTVNCGACNTVCPASAPYCEQGVCTANAPCPGFQTRCSGACYDLYNDSSNCGVSCETRVVCGQFENCTGGACVPNDPPPPNSW